MKRQHVVNGSNVMLMRVRDQNREMNAKDCMLLARDEWEALTPRQRAMFNLEGRALTDYHARRRDEIERNIKEGVYGTDLEFEHRFRKNPHAVVNSDWMFDNEGCCESMRIEYEGTIPPEALIALSGLDDEAMTIALAAIEAGAEVEIDRETYNFKFDYCAYGGARAASGARASGEQRKRKAMAPVPGACSKCRHRGCARCRDGVDAAAKAASDDGGEAC